MDKATRRAERLTQARQLADQARQNRSTAWYVPFTITSIGAGASFDSFGRSIGFLYALGLAITFVVVTWSTVRLLPSVTAELGIGHQSVPGKLLALVGAPMTMHWSLVAAAALPTAIALIKAVGFYAIGGAMIVFIVAGIALLAAWALDRHPHGRA